MIGTRPRVTRLVVAALLVLPALVASVSPSLAAPSKQDVEAAHQKLLAAQDHFAALNEQYNEAVYQLQQAQQHLADTLAMKKAAEAQASTARAALSKRAVQAYTDLASIRGVGLSLIGLAATEAAEQRPERAVQLAAAAEVYAHQEGIVNVYSEETPGREFVDRARATLSPDDIERATHMGRKLTIKEALDLARFSEAASA